MWTLHCLNTLLLKSNINHTCHKKTRLHPYALCSSATMWQGPRGGVPGVMLLLSFLWPLPCAPEKRCMHNRSCRTQYPFMAPLNADELVTHLLIMPHFHLSLPEARGPLVIHPGPSPHNISIFLQICRNSPPPAFSNLSSTPSESHSLSPANVPVSQSL